MLLGLGFSLVQATDTPLSAVEPRHAAYQVSHDIEVTHTTPVTQAIDFQTLTFTVRLHNEGPNSAPNLVFTYRPAAVFGEITTEYQFQLEAPDGTREPLSPSEVPGQEKQWAFNQDIPANHTVIVTFTGQVSYASTCWVQFDNRASIEGISDTDLTNNHAQASFRMGEEACLYLPMLLKRPAPTPTPTPTDTATPTNTPDPTITPTPTHTPDPTPPPFEELLFHDDFSDDDNWRAEQDDGCNAEVNFDDNEYEMDANDPNQECWATCTADALTNRADGLFRVEAEAVRGDDNFSYGLYINGAGGDDFYRFRVFPNNDCTIGGGWLLERERDGHYDILNGNAHACHEAINRGSITNELSFYHTPIDHLLIVYANDQFLGYYDEDDDDVVEGIDSGLYIQADDAPLEIDFDEFQVYRLD